LTNPQNDWNPEAYERYRGFRLRPALDLLAQVPALPPGAVVDLGCGTGAVGPALRQRFPDRALVGVDSSSSMLEQAAGTGCYDTLLPADIADWSPAVPPALIFSNAALQWLDDHDALFPRLAAGLAAGGVLAVQMPHQSAAPSHGLLHQLAARLWPGRFPPEPRRPVAEPTAYWRLLSPFGRVEIWQTEYLQGLPPASVGHPVRHFTESTAMRPYLQPLAKDEADAFTAAYDRALSAAYPLLPDGGVLFPFRRLFFTLQV
jgi:trans-aconitate 2-methyltransferase